jgi:hypothetical protein
MQVFVESGTAGGSQTWVLTTQGTITLGTTALAFAPLVIPSPAFTYKTVTGTTYTHIISDSSKRLALTNAGTKTVTIAPNSSVASPVNSEIEVFNAGAGLATIAPGAGVTLNAAGADLTVPLNAVVRLKKRSANVWDVTTRANLSFTRDATTVTVASDAGTDAVLPAATTSLAGVMTAADKTKLDATPPGVAVTALSISSGVVNIDCALGDYFTLALTANVTSITFSNLPGSGKAATKAVRMQQDGTGARTVAFPSSFKATGGSDTAVQSAANAYTVFMFTSFDNGTRWEYTMRSGAA